MSRWRAPIVRAFVWVLKCFSYLTPSLLVVQLLLLTVIAQLCGISASLYQAERWYWLANIRNGRIDQPVVLTAVISVTHLWLPGWIAFSRPLLSDPVTTSCVIILPIIKPVQAVVCVVADSLYPALLADRWWVWIFTEFCYIREYILTDIIKHSLPYEYLLCREESVF